MSDSDFTINIEQLQDQPNDIEKDVECLLKDVQDNGNVIEEIKKRLETNQEELNLQICTRYAVHP